MSIRASAACFLIVLSLIGIYRMGKTLADDEEWLESPVVYYTDHDAGEAD